LVRQRLDYRRGPIGLELTTGGILGRKDPEQRLVAIAAICDNIGPDLAETEICFLLGGI